MVPSFNKLVQNILPVNFEVYSLNFNRNLMNKKLDINL